MSSNQSMETVGSFETSGNVILHGVTFQNAVQTVPALTNSYDPGEELVKRKFLEHATILHRRIFVIGGVVLERPRSEQQEPTATLLLPETTHADSSTYIDTYSTEDIKRNELIEMCPVKNDETVNVYVPTYAVYVSSNTVVCHCAVPL